MTEKAAIEYLNSIMPRKVSEAELYGAVGCYGTGKLVYEDVDGYAYETAIKALEKQVPKKPVETLEVKPVYDENGAYIDADTYINLHCPSCGEWVGMADNGCSNYCCSCGQAIDWKEVEECK